MMNMEKVYVRVEPQMNENRKIRFACNTKVGDKLVYQRASGYLHLHFPKNVTVVGDYPRVLVLKCDTNILCANKASIYTGEDVLYFAEKYSE